MPEEIIHNPDIRPDKFGKLRIWWLMQQPVRDYAQAKRKKDSSTTSGRYTSLQLIACFLTITILPRSLFLFLEKKGEREVKTIQTNACVVFSPIRFYDAKL